MEFHSEVRSLQKELDRELRRRDKDLFNRLWSIKHDANFVATIAERFQTFPVVANLRCGAWYTEPRRTKATCYFKSTDGHAGQWSFSLKRHNLGLVDVISRNGGCIIVDSTRSGKTMPDALSKTLPTWCAVLNRASVIKHGSSSEQRGFEKHAVLVTPDQLVSRSEHSQIEARIEEWAKMLLDSDLTVPNLRVPLRPFFITTDTSLDDVGAMINASDGLSPSFHPVILLSASRSRSQALPASAGAHQLSSTRNSQNAATYPAFDYVQGSGDDHENWALGLTPALFWEADNHRRILAAARGAELERLVRELVAQSTSSSWIGAGDAGSDAPIYEATRVGATALHLGTVPSSSSNDPRFKQWREDSSYRFSLVVQCDGDAKVEDGLGHLRDDEERFVVLGLKQGKAGAGPFGHHLPSIVNALIVRIDALHARHRDEAAPSVLLCDSVGRDLAPSLAVAILAACYGPDQGFLRDPQARWTHQAQLDKDQVRRRLQWVMEAAAAAAAAAAGGAGAGVGVGSAGPARTFLNRVNAEVLAGGRRPDYA